MASAGHRSVPERARRDLQHPPLSTRHESEQAEPTPPPDPLPRIRRNPNGINSLKSGHVVCKRPLEIVGGTDRAVVRRVRLVRMVIDAAGRAILEKANAGGNALGRWSGVVFGSSFGAKVLAAGQAITQAGRRYSAHPFLY